MTKLLGALISRHTIKISLSDKVYNDNYTVFSTRIYTKWVNRPICVTAVHLDNTQGACAAAALLMRMGPAGTVMNETIFIIGIAQPSGVYQNRMQSRLYEFLANVNCYRRPPVCNVRAPYRQLKCSVHLVPWQSVTEIVPGEPLRPRGTEEG